MVTPSASHPNPLISHDKLRQLYSMMLKCRLLDELARMLRKQAGFEDDRDSSIGQEAIAVGAAIDLRPEDTVAPSRGDLILSYIKGAPLVALFSQLYERTTRPDRGRVLPDDSEYAPQHIIIPASTLDAQLDLCTDIAVTNQRKKNDEVVMVFSGEKAASPDAWHQALHFAGVRSLPIVFVCANNMLAESASAQPEESFDNISPKADGFGFDFPGITVDGKDAVAMYRVAHEAVERARFGGGPTLIEAQTFPEYGPNYLDLAQYRAADSVEEWESSDPIAAMERYLTGKGLFSEGWKKEIIAAFQQELDAAVEVAEDDRCGASA